MKKRITALALAVFIMIFALCSCGKGSGVSVGGTEIAAGVYAYFTDLAERENPDNVTEAVNKSLSEYVAVNSEFSLRELSLDTSEKTELSDTVNSYWRLFSAYYEEIGVSKQDIYNIEQSKAYREKLMESYYSSGGDSPVSDEELRTYFSENFIAFRAITGFLTTVDSENKTVSLPEEDRQTVIDIFNKMSSEINDGISDFDAVSAYADNVVVTSETVVIDKDTSDYPDGFYDAASGIENDKAASFVIGDYIYTVQRFDINSQELNLFENYKSDCLKSLKGAEFDEVVSDWASAYTVA